MDNILNIFGELDSTERGLVKDYAVTLVFARLQRTIKGLEENRSQLIKEKGRLADEVIDLTLKLEDSNGS